MHAIHNVTLRPQGQGRNGSSKHDKKGNRGNLITGALFFTVVDTRPHDMVQILVSRRGKGGFPPEVMSHWMVGRYPVEARLEDFERGRGVSLRPGVGHIRLEVNENYVALAQYNPGTYHFVLLNVSNLEDYQDAERRFGLK